MPFELVSFSVAELVRSGELFVEDGNHGEYRPLAHEFSETGTPFIRPDNLANGELRFEGCDRINEVAARRVRKGKGKAGDILFTHRATVGRIARVGPTAPDFVANPGVTVWRVSDGRRIDRDYLYYYMQSSAFMDQVWSMAGGTDTFPYISLTQQRTLLLELAPVAEQRAIGSVLGTLDDRISLLRQTKATLESIAQALFKSWFIDFDPVRAKAEGREPEGMDAATAALFPAEFEDSALGLIPKGSRAGTVEELFVLQRGFDLPAKQRTDGRHTVFAASGPHGTHMEAMAKGPGVVTGRSGVIGKVYFAHDDYWPLNTALWVKEFKRASPAFAFQFLQTMDLMRLNAGSAVPSLNRNHVHAQPAVVPPAEQVAAFNGIAMPLLQRIRANELHAGHLGELRDTLLPRLISGKLRLPEAQASLEDALA